MMKTKKEKSCPFMEEVISHVHASLNQYTWLVQIPGAPMHLRNLNSHLHEHAQRYSRDNLSQDPHCPPPPPPPQ